MESTVQTEEYPPVLQKPHLIHRIRAGVKRVKRAITPGRRAWVGATLGLMVAAVFTIGITAFSLLAVPKPNLDGLVAVAVLVVVSALTGALLHLVVKLLQALPSLFRWALASVVMLVGISFMSNLWMSSLIMSVGLAIALTLVGAGAWVLARGGWRDTTHVKRAIAVLGLALGIVALVGGWAWLANEGSPLEPLPDAAALSGAIVPPLDLADPSTPGEHDVLTLTYGSGRDRLRPEFGEQAVLVTSPVDGSLLIDGWSGPAGESRTRYWGFDTKELPLNGRVWYPDGEGPFPLALIVHGNHGMDDYSDSGYDYIGELLASRGFILVSVDENFLNSGMSDLLSFPNIGLQGENDARGWLLLEHLRVWQEWNDDPANPFYHKVDTENLAVMGHSRGGEAAAVAAAFNRLPYYPDDAALAFDYNFNIRSVVAIAPVDGQYKPTGLGTPLENVNYFVFHGSLDGDMQSFHGARQYERVRFTDGEPWFKASLYIHGANHGQFNTTWGRVDAGGITSGFFNLEPILPVEQQEQIAKVYVTAFLEATLGGRPEYSVLFRDHRAAAEWLPQTIYLNQYEDSTYRFVSTFEEDINLASTTLPGGEQAGHNLAVWREQVVGIKWGNKDTSAVYLGWMGEGADEPAWYSIRLPQHGLALDANSVLLFSLADANESPGEHQGQEQPDEVQAGQGDEKAQPIDLTIEVIDVAGNAARLPLSSFSLLQPQIEAQVAKLAFMNPNAASEAVFQSFEFPLAAFAAENPVFDPARLVEVRFLFDLTSQGVIILDGVGFRQADPPLAR